jgi:hypothetical protein
MPITPEGKTQVSLQLNDDVVRAVEQYRFKRQFESKVAAFENLLRYAVKANPPKPEDAK